MKFLLILLTALLLGSCAAQPTEKASYRQISMDEAVKMMAEETDCIINLASKEYSSAVFKYVPDSVRFLTCTFGELKNGKVIEKATMCKMARGEMVRFMAQNQITDPEEIKSFSMLDFRYSPEYSTSQNFTFLR